MSGKTRVMLENLVKEGSFKWLLGNRTPFDDEFEEMGKSPSTQKNWIPELSLIANMVVRRCSKILGVPTAELQENFDSQASDALKHPSQYARNFLEYCSFRAISLSVRVTGHLADKKFRRLTFDVMLAWEAPEPSTEASLHIDEDLSAGIEAFSRIAPAVPIIADVVVSENLFNVLTSSTGGRLKFSIYDKYLTALERALRKMKSQSDSTLLAALRSVNEEKILEVDGTVTTQPVLEHAGISTWPGRLVLTDHALYFEAHRVVSYEKAKRYDLSEDLKQVVKPELSGPWGTRIFDKAVFYKSTSLQEPVILEFPELKGNTRRDYWLAIIREVLYVHRFIKKFQIKGVGRDEAISKAVLGILRLQSVQEINSSSMPLRSEALLMFNFCDQLPGGDLILETLANMSVLREADRANNSQPGSGMYSISALDMVSNLGSVFGANPNSPSKARLVVGGIMVGESTSLEKAVKESKNDYKKVVVAQATVDGVKVEGIETNIAVMKELLYPMMQLGNFLLSLVYWDDPMKSLTFCCITTYVIFRQWVGYAFATMLVLIAIFMILTRLMSQGNPVDEVKVLAPPPMNTMEQLLAVQNAISQFQGFVQDGNIVLLKLRALLMSIFPQASMKLAIALLVTAFVLASVPSRYVAVIVFLESFTRYSPPRKASTEKWMRRLREWWFSIPAAPVVLQTDNEDKKRK